MAVLTSSLWSANSLEMLVDCRSRRQTSRWAAVARLVVTCVLIVLELTIENRVINLEVAQSQIV